MSGCIASRCYRLVYGESDGLPGLVLDRYGDMVVAQSGTAGMDRLRAEIEAAVNKVIHAQDAWCGRTTPARASSKAWKRPRCLRTATRGPRRRPKSSCASRAWSSSRRLPRARRPAGSTTRPPIASGCVATCRRARACSMSAAMSARGPCRALKGGAASATCVDSSATALDYVARNARANGVNVETVKDDAFDALKALQESGAKFDVVMLDPPAFAKRKKDAPQAQAAYRKLNQLALPLIDRDGLLVSCSCSYHMGADELMASIQTAARHTSRFVQVLELGGQSPDHPVHPAIPETRYLKAFFCRVTRE